MTIRTCSYTFSLTCFPVPGAKVCPLEGSDGVCVTPKTVSMKGLTTLWSVWESENGMTKHRGREKGGKMSRARRGKWWCWVCWCHLRRHHRNTWKRKFSSWCWLGPYSSYEVNTNKPPHKYDSLHRSCGLPSFFFSMLATAYPLSLPSVPAVTVMGSIVLPNILRCQAGPVMLPMVIQRRIACSAWNIRAQQENHLCSALLNLSWDSLSVFVLSDGFCASIGVTGGTQTYASSTMSLLVSCPGYFLTVQV